MEEMLGQGTSQEGCRCPRQDSTLIKRGQWLPVNPPSDHLVKGLLIKLGIVSHPHAGGEPQDAEREREGFSGCGACLGPGPGHREGRPRWSGGS